MSDRGRVTRGCRGVERERLRQMAPAKPPQILGTRSALGANATASRSRGPRKIAPLAGPSQGGIAHTPRGYRRATVRTRGIASRGLPQAAICLTLPFGAPMIRRTTTRRALSGARRVSCLSGAMTDEPRGRSRGSDSPDEADLPAQEASPRQGARLPRPDEIHGRTSCLGRAPGSRSEAADGLTSERGPNSPRLVMLSRPQEFAAIQERGTARSHPLLTARVLRTDLELTRFGLATGRSLGSAVVRNRIRRRLREALRAMAPAFRPGWDVLIIARPESVAAGQATLASTLQALLARAGVVDNAGEGETSS